MKSKTSFFNRGISRNLLRRFWPLWAAYLAVLLLLVPGTLGPQAASILQGTNVYLDAQVIELGLGLVYFSAAVGVVTAMAMFHYLYGTRACGMMNTLPVRRETMFCTAYLTGLVPLLLSDVFVMLLTAILYCREGLVSLPALLDWLALVAMGNVAFYGFAVFCAMLTGNLLVLPLLYVVLNFTAVVVEAFAMSLLQIFVFGMTGRGLKLVFLSPVVKLWQTLRVNVNYDLRTYTLEGLGVLGAYCAAGLLLSAAALLLYRRRRMESATDVVAIPVLKPVFKYCLCLGTALVFAWLVNSLFLDLTPGGGARAWVVLTLLLVGAFIGYFAAEMLLQKTLKVFGGHWRGFAAACAALVLFVCLFEFDAFGYERRVPAAESVKHVTVQSMGRGATLTKPEDIAAALDFHRAVIADKKSCDTSSGYFVQLEYVTENDKTLLRAYRLPVETAKEPDSLARQAEALLNKPDALLSRAVPEIPVERGTVAAARVEYGQWVDWRDDGVQDFAYSGYELTSEEAVSLYREGVLPDAEAGAIGRVHLVTDEAYYESAYPLKIRIDLRDSSVVGYRSYYYVRVDVEADSVNTLRWLAEHTDLELKTCAEWGITEQSDTGYYLSYGAG